MAFEDVVMYVSRGSKNGAEFEHKKLEGLTSKTTIEKKDGGDKEIKLTFTNGFCPFVFKLKMDAAAVDFRPNGNVIYVTKTVYSR